MLHLSYIFLKCEYLFMKKTQINTVPKNEDIKSMLVGIHFSIQIVYVKCLYSVTWSGLNVVIVN